MSPEAEGLKCAPLRTAEAPTVHVGTILHYIRLSCYGRPIHHPHTLVSLTGIPTLRQWHLLGEEP
jgi:hypothetical protein